MKTLELIENFPLTMGEIQSYLYKKLLDSIKEASENVPEEYLEHLKNTEISSDKISSLVEVNPRILFEFFDEHEIYVETIRYDNKFVCRINGEKKSSEEDRLSAEVNAIEKCFPILEDILTEKEEEHGNN